MVAFAKSASYARNRRLLQEQLPLLVPPPPAERLARRISIAEESRALERQRPDPDWGKEEPGRPER